MKASGGIWMRARTREQVIPPAPSSKLGWIKGKGKDKKAGAKIRPFSQPFCMVGKLDYALDVHQAMRKKGRLVAGCMAH